MKVSVKIELHSKMPHILAIIHIDHRVEYLPKNAAWFEVSATVAFDFTVQPPLSLITK